jgi:hypothetical protein
MMIPPGDLAGRKAIAGAPRGLAARHEKPIKIVEAGESAGSQWRLFHLQDAALSQAGLCKIAQYCNF